MSKLAKLGQDNEVETEKDSLGFTGVLPSDLYNAVINAAFITETSSGAMAFNVHFTTEQGQPYREIFYITSSDAKGNKEYYVNKKTGVKHYLPGYNQANSLCLLTTGFEIADMETEEKVIDLYDFEEQAEVPTEVDMVTALNDKFVILGIVEIHKNKSVKNDNGDYVDTNEIRKFNEIDKIFGGDSDEEDFYGKTTYEIRNELDGSFKDKWLKKWEGKVKNQYKEIVGKKSRNVKRTNNTPGEKKKKLFGKK
jgi:hypothetical protein